MVSDDPALSYWWDGIFVSISRDPSLTPTQHRVLSTRLQHVRQNHHDVTHPTIANETGLSLSTVKKVSRWLIDNGYLLTEKRSNTCGFRAASEWFVGPRCQESKVSSVSKVSPVTPQKEKLVSLVLKSVDQVQVAADIVSPVTLTPLESTDLPTGVSDQQGAESGLIVPRTERAEQPMSVDRAIDRVLAQLQHRRKITSGWIASCPVPGHGQGHGDRNPSLSIGEHDGKVLINCQSGCHIQDVLIAIGLDYPDLFDEPIANDRGVKVAEWTYVNADGQPWFIAERWQTPTGKRFAQRKPDSPEPGLGKNFFYCLYRLDKVLEACRNHEQIWLVEGEKAVHAGLSLGMVATTAPLGAGKWRADYNRWLIGASCVNIVMDNDTPGRDHAMKVQASLAEAGIPTKVWKVAVTDAKADLYDHVAKGYGIAHLKLTRLDVTVPTTWSFRQATTTVFPERQWVIKEVLPTGMCLLSGSSKIGKSVLAVGMSLSVASGSPWLKRFHVEQGAVLHLGLDNEGMRDLVDRFKQAKEFYNVTSLDQSIALNEALREGEDGESATGERARQMIRGWHAERIEAGELPRLVVVDTLSKIEPDYEGDGRKDQYLASTSVLSQWAHLAMDLDIALVCVHHSTKSEEGSWVSRGFMGSRGLTATAHTLMFLDAKHGADSGTLRVTGRHVPTGDYPLLRKGMQWADSIEETSRTSKVPAGVIQGPWR